MYYQLLSTYKSTLIQSLLFGNLASRVETNTFILIATIKYSLCTMRFKEVLF